MEDFKDKIGCACWFFRYFDDDDKVLGILTDYKEGTPYPFTDDRGVSWGNCWVARKGEIKIDGTSSKATSALS